MNIIAIFDYQDNHYELSREDLKLDRNYQDEPTAYFLEPIPETEDGYFEVNIIKVDGEMQERGYVAVYDSIDDTNYKELINAEIVFDSKETQVNTLP